MGALATTLPANAQAPVNPSLLNAQWPASWITHADAPQRGYGIYHFRKTIHLPARPEKFIIHLSADNRYRFFVNGKPVCNGPARGDLYNWYFESIDIAPFLKEGDNTLAALVWNMGEHAAVAQVSNQTAFTIQGDGPTEQLVNTDNSWKVFRDMSYQPVSLDNGPRLRTYMVIGPGDQVDASLYPYGWEQQGYDDTKWSAAKRITHPVPVGYGTDNMWTLTPRTIPLMEETQQRIPFIRRASGLASPPQKIDEKHPLTIPAHSTVSILLDQSVNTVAYPELYVSGGKGANIKMTYAESLFEPAGPDGRRGKGNRNEIDGKEIQGNYDIFLPDGGGHRSFRPLWLRTWRYLQLDIVTGDADLSIDDLYGMYTGYPFSPKASFASNDSSLQAIWNTGWRTARLCAGENYFDCPYYEQLQYEGDTRIQSLISLYVAGDDRLMRKALVDFYNSRVPEGLTQGRYPSNRLQVIPPFSLFWVSMVYDYFMHRKDDAFTKQFLMAVKGVLAWYEDRMDKEKGMLGPMKWWNFVDWNKAFPNGVPAGANDGNSSIISLQYAYTLKQAAELFAYFGEPQTAAHYRTLAATLQSSTYTRCFDKGKKEMADNPDKNSFSQHAGIMGVLTGAVPATEQAIALDKILHDTSLSQATFYYRFYLNRALLAAGMGDLYYSQLTPWRNMLKMGLTTFAENPDPTRSDCHAWSASPNYDFLATICGIMPAAPGFTKVRIQPNMGELKSIRGRMPHPAGEIIVSVDKTNSSSSGFTADITLPPTLTGTFIWHGQQYPLKPGLNKLK